MALNTPWFEFAADIAGVLTIITMLLLVVGNIFVIVAIKSKHQGLARWLICRAKRVVWIFRLGGADGHQTDGRRVGWRRQTLS